MSTPEPDELEKIAQLAVQRGYWDQKAAMEGVATARHHTPAAGSMQPPQAAQRTFLRKLIERTCGLTYDELARLEKDALAPPQANTPSKPLPRLGSGRPAQEVTEVTSETSAPPAPPTSREETMTPQKKLPKFSTAKPAQEATEVTSEASPPPAPPSGRDEIITPTKKLPRLNAPKKKPEDPPPE